MMDPQQRVLLQHAWEALSAVPATECSLTSVAIGIGTVEYTALAAHVGNSIFVATGARVVHVGGCCPSAVVTLQGLGSHVLRLAC